VQTEHYHMMQLTEEMMVQNSGDGEEDGEDEEG
jgi:hypothetical protein